MENNNQAKSNVLKGVNKKIKRKIIIIGVSSALTAMIILAIVIGVSIYYKNINDVDFIMDTQYKYLITSTDLFTTQKEDGSYTYTYYQIDIQENMVRKYEYFYNGKLGKKSKDKMVYKKALSGSESNELKSLLDNVIVNGNSVANTNYNPSYSAYLISRGSLADNVMLIEMNKTEDMDIFNRLVGK